MCFTSPALRPDCSNWRTILRPAPGRLASTMVSPSASSIRWARPAISPVNSQMWAVIGFINDLLSLLTRPGIAAPFQPILILIERPFQRLVEIHPGQVGDAQQREETVGQFGFPFVVGEKRLAPVAGDLERLFRQLADLRSEIEQSGLDPRFQPVIGDELRYLLLITGQALAHGLLSCGCWGCMVVPRPHPFR